MKIPVVFAFALMIWSPESGANFNVGPCRLGMTNAQAAKYGLKECKETFSRIECIPVFDSSIKLRRSLIAFDAKTKRVVEISATMVHFTHPGMEGAQISAALANSKWKQSDWFQNAQRMGTLLKTSLLLSPCPSELVEYDDYTARKTEKCHLLPDSTRTVMFGYNDTYDGSVRHANEPHITAYVTVEKGNEVKGFVQKLKENAAKKRKESSLKEFAAGK